MTLWLFIQPVDSLFFRGNLSFGEAGEHGTGTMPPQPSVMAGALRSAILGAHPEALHQFTREGRCQDPHLAQCLGTPQKPGTFRLRALHLARRRQGQYEPLHPLPADLVRLESGLYPLIPQSPDPGMILGPQPLPKTALLHCPRTEKPRGGGYLTPEGWRAHLRGEIPEASRHVVEDGELHRTDPRLGIGLDPRARTAREGLIYTTDGHALTSEGPDGTATGFLVGVDGADAFLEREGLLRLGGDGRAAGFGPVDFEPEAPPLEAIARNRRFRLILDTPGLFAGGHLPQAIQQQGDQHWLHGEGFSARLTCCAHGRPGIISGWDLQQWCPKPARRVVPAGAVYWFEDLQGDPEALAAWVADGLARDPACSEARRAEGYNQATLAA